MSVWKWYTCFYGCSQISYVSVDSTPEAWFYMKLFIGKCVMFQETPLDQIMNEFHKSSLMLCLYQEVFLIPHRWSSGYQYGYQYGHRGIESWPWQLHFVGSEMLGPVYCAISVHIKECQAVKIFGAFHYGVSIMIAWFWGAKPQKSIISRSTSLHYYNNEAESLKRKKDTIMS